MTEADYKGYVKNRLKIGMICVLNCKDPESDEGVGRRTRKKRCVLEVQGFYRHVVMTKDQTGRIQTFKYIEMYKMLKEAADEQSNV